MSDYQPPVFQPNPLTNPLYTDSGSGNSYRQLQQLSIMDARPYCDGVHDDSEAFNSLAFYLFSTGGGRIFIPNFLEKKFYLGASINLYPSVWFDGIGYGYITLLAGANCAIFATPFFEELLAGSTTGVPLAQQNGSYDVQIRNLWLDGNATQQKTVSFNDQTGISILGTNQLLDNVIITNVVGHGFRTAISTAAAQTFQNQSPAYRSTYKRLFFVNVGGHGWWDSNVHDKHAYDITSQDASQAGQGLYDAFNLETGGRYDKLHGWSSGVYDSAVKLPRSALYQSGSQGQFLNCQFESCLTSIICTGVQNIFDGIECYALGSGVGQPATPGSAMITLSDSGVSGSNIISNSYFDARQYGNAALNDIYGISFGDPTTTLTSSGNVVTGAVFRDFGTRGPFNFQYDGGHNRVSNCLGTLSPLSTSGIVAFPFPPAAQTEIDFYQWASSIYNQFRFNNHVELLNASSVQVVTTGFSYNVPNSESCTIFNPATTLATGAIVLPNGAYDRQVCTFVTTNTITALTVTAGDFAAVLGAPSSLTPIAPCSFIFIKAIGTNGIWIRKSS